MNKSRVEALSDGVFAIVMTLLIFDVKIPEVAGPMTNAHLWYLIGTLWPLFVSYAFSFLVLSVFWINHHFLFHTFVKKIDRYLNLMNMLYLMFLAFIPFSAHLFGTYPANQPAAIVYGFNILAVVVLLATMVRYVRKHEGMGNDLEPRLVKQARIRGMLTTYSYVIGIAASFVFIPATIFFYIFPMVFNIVPGTLNLAEKVFRFDLG